MEPTELVDGFAVGFEIKRSQGCPEVESPLTEVGKTKSGGQGRGPGWRYLEKLPESSVRSIVLE